MSCCCKLSKKSELLARSVDDAFDECLPNVFLFFFGVFVVIVFVFFCFFYLPPLCPLAFATLLVRLLSCRRGDAI